MNEIMDWKRITRLFRRPQLQPALHRGAAEGKWESGSASFASASRKYKLWVPATCDPQAPSPLVMMLHGCTQKPEDLAETSGMNAVADNNNFLVAYPEQPVRANLLRCWNWFDPKHQSRGAGEPAVLAAVIEQIGSSHNVDASRVYVAGISAGAAMAVVLAATYPDLVTAVGVVAGLEFKAATSMVGGLAAMKKGGPDPEQQGLVAFQTMSDGLRDKPKGRMPVTVFQGTADPYLNPLNAGQVIMQWAKTNHCLEGNGAGRDAFDAGGELISGSVPGGYRFDKHTYKDGAGRLLMEKWMVEGMGHAWPGSPVTGDFADPKGPPASKEMWRFFCDTTSQSLAYPTARKALWDRLVHLLHGTRQ
jgi:poly(hydroxyalkanoate) depolymerase family esterase